MVGTNGAIRNAGAMDRAAVCIMAVLPMAKCELSVKDKLCAVFCCCNANPIIKGKKRKGYKQICADAMLRARKADEEGILSSVPYDMSKTPPMPILRSNYRARTALIYKGEDGDVELLPSERIPLKGRRIPDIVVVKDPTRPPTQDNIAKIYDFKFPGDRWRVNQKEDYQRIQGEKGPEVEALNEKSCKCAEMDEEKCDNIDEQTIAEANQALEDIFAELNGKCAYNGHFDMLDMSAVREELERQARYNTTPAWIHRLLGAAISAVAKAAGFGAVAVVMPRLAPLAGQEARNMLSELPETAVQGFVPWLTSNINTP